MKQANTAKLELVEETQYKKARFALSAIGVGLAGLAFVILALAYPYLYL